MIRRRSRKRSLAASALRFGNRGDGAPEDDVLVRPFHSLASNKLESKGVRLLRRRALLRLTRRTAAGGCLGAERLRGTDRCDVERPSEQIRLPQSALKRARFGSENTECATGTCCYLTAERDDTRFSSSGKGRAAAGERSAVPHQLQEESHGVDWLLTRRRIRWRMRKRKQPAASAERPTSSCVSTSLERPRRTETTNVRTFCTPSRHPLSLALSRQWVQGRTGPCAGRRSRK